LGSSILHRAANPNLRMRSEKKRFPHEYSGMMDNECMVKPHFDRIVIGGGLFGSFAALALAKRGLRVCLVEQGSELLGRASLINQARLHTGLHYPRSLDTAKESIVYYDKFRSSFPSAVRDFDQIYAISRYSSKTSGEDFLAFINRLDIKVQEIPQTIYFQKSTISHAFRVEEPTFDAEELRKILKERINASANITLRLNSKVTGGDIGNSFSTIQLDNGHALSGGGLVIAAYAGINGLREMFGLKKLPLSFEIADVFLGLVPDSLKNIGFTVMDGPFWSMMPFGHSNFSSLTSVGLTPIEKSNHFPIFSCQTKRLECVPSGLADCNSCDFRPTSNFEHIQQQVSMHLKDSIRFDDCARLTTVKTVLTSSEVDDSRPTLIEKENNLNVWTIFSGKITTIFDIEEGLS
jgi:hypothetical protein